MWLTYVPTKYYFAIRQPHQQHDFCRLNTPPLENECKQTGIHCFASSPPLIASYLVGSYTGCIDLSGFHDLRSRICEIRKRAHYRNR